MSNDVWRWVIGLAVLAHGLGHVLFLPAMSGLMKLQATGHSWLLTGWAGDGPTKLLASIVAGVVLAAFVGAAAGIFIQGTWWRPVAIAASVASLVLIVAMWDGLPTSPAVSALVFDAVVLAALLVAHWPSEEMIGA
jgi:hypothetical protein